MSQRWRRETLRVCRTQSRFSCCLQYFDTSSIPDTPWSIFSKLKNKEKLFKVLSESCKKKLFFEGNANSDIQFITEGLLKAGFREVNYIGMSEDEKIKETYSEEYKENVK